MTEAGVFRLLTEMTGADAQDNPVYESLVFEACEEIRGRIKAETTESELEEYSKRLEFAAAAEAFYRLALIGALTTPVSIKAGEISITNPSDTKGAEKLLHYALACISAVADDGAFCFMGVEMT